MRHRVSTPGKTAHTLAIAAAGTAIATLIPVALYQCGSIPHLPDPPGAYFASEAITSSKAAHPLGIPDSLPGLASYGISMALLLAARKSSTARTLLHAKLLADGSLAAINMTRQIISFRKLCSWCTGTALATAVLVPAGLAFLKKRS
jgi:uncharacterized membrane protein